MASLSGTLAEGHSTVGQPFQESRKAVWPGSLSLLPILGFHAHGSLAPLHTSSHSPRI